MSAFLENWPVNGLVFNRFNRLELHSLMVGIFDPACELLPPWTKELYLCTVAPLPSFWPPPPSQTKCTVYTDSVWLWGGGVVLNCVVDHILQEFYTLFLTTFRTCKIASPTQTKISSKANIYGLKSLKLFRPCPLHMISIFRHKYSTSIESFVSNWVNYSHISEMRAQVLYYVKLHVCN